MLIKYITHSSYLFAIHLKYFSYCKHIINIRYNNPRIYGLYFRIIIYYLYYHFNYILSLLKKFQETLTRLPWMRLCGPPLLSRNFGNRLNRRKIRVTENSLTAKCLSRRMIYGPRNWRENPGL